MVLIFMRVICTIIAGHNLHCASRRGGGGGERERERESGKEWSMMIYRYNAWKVSEGIVVCMHGK